LDCAVIGMYCRPRSLTLRWKIDPIAEMTTILGHENDVDNNSNFATSALAAGKLSRASDAEPHQQTAPNSNSKTQPHSFNNPPPTKQKHLAPANMLFTTQIVALTLAFAAHTRASTSKPAPAEGVTASPKVSTTVTPAHANITEVTPAHADTAVTPAPADTAVSPTANATTGVPPTTPNVTVVVPSGSGLPSEDSVPLPVPAGPPVHGDMSSGKCMCPPPRESHPLISSRSFLPAQNVSLTVFRTATCASFVDPKVDAHVVSPSAPGVAPPLTNSKLDDDTPQGNNTEGNSTSTGTPSVLNSFSLAGFMAAGAVAFAL
ncbi:hypothetical protein PSTT_13024, partial [Puccinia striiformis]